MREIPIFYATTEGQTRRIAEHLAAAFRQQGFDSGSIDLSSPEAAHVDWTRVRAVLLGASLHGGKHQRQAGAFARAHREALNARQSAFFSVSLSAGSSNRSEVEAVAVLAQSFAAETGWRPSQVVCFPGRLAYTRYGWLKRLVMRRIARKEGGPTDMTRDHELTRWPDVTRLAVDMGRTLRRDFPILGHVRV
jgi:menaquinone-dependent protoporphyrinogen oxidase